MNTKNILQVIEIVISIFLIISILLQEKEGGLGTVFGGSSGGESYRTKRGLELFLTRSTVILIIALIVNTLAIVYLGI